MDVTQKLMLILEDRGWSEYRLAKESNLPHSTVLYFPEEQSAVYFYIGSHVQWFGHNISSIFY